MLHHLFLFVSSRIHCSIWDQSNRVDSNFGPYGGYSGYPAAGGGHSSGPQSAVASASLGPQGGFQTAQISPVRKKSFFLSYVIFFNLSRLVGSRESDVFTFSW